MVTKKSADHPLYIDMIIASIKALKNRKGSSKIAIVKYIKSNYTVSGNVDQIVKMTLLRNLDNGKIKQTSGVGAAGSFKVGDTTKPQAETPKKAPSKTKTPKKKSVSTPKPTPKKKINMKKKAPQKSKATKKIAKKSSRKGKK